MGHAIVNKGQSIYDLCLKAYGTISKLSTGESALFKFIRENNISNINSSVGLNTILTFDASLVLNDFEEEFITLASPIAIAVGGYELRDDDGYELRDDGGYELKDM